VEVEPIAVNADIPYYAQMKGIFRDHDKPEYYCALDPLVNEYPEEDTTELRDKLEQILSEATGKEMELGLAELVLDIPTGKYLTMCHFKEKGVKQCLC
jgi:hypothetical protein